MEARNGKTTVWVPREAFESVHRLWKPEFSWVPVPVDRSLPPAQIAYIDAAGPISPLPPPPSRPVPPTPGPEEPGLYPAGLKTPRTPRTPLDLPPLETVRLLERRQSGYFHGASPAELETAITRGFSPVGSDEPSTPSTATEPESPATPKDNLSLPKPIILEERSPNNSRSEQLKPVAIPPAPSQDSPIPRAPSPIEEEEEDEEEESGENFRTGPWKLIDRRPKYKPKHGNLKPASWKTLDGQRDLKMHDHWQAFRRDEAHWNGSPKGFAVRLDMHLNVELELKGTVNGDITLSAEALYVSSPSQCVLSIFAGSLTYSLIPRHYDVGECPLMSF